MIGAQEMVLIGVAIVFLFGAAKLPELARSVGRASGEYTKAKKEIEKELEGLK